MIKDIDSFGDSYELIDIWEKFEGKIDCEYTGKIWSASELIDLSKAKADEMRVMGLKRGDIVAVILSNTISFPIMLMALLYLGCNPLMLDAAIMQNEFLKLINKVPIKYFIHDSIKNISCLSLDTFAVSQIFISDLPVFIGKVNYYPEGEFTELQATVLHMTSGTFGMPGICIRNQKVALAEARNYISEIDIYNRKRIMITTPLSHAFGYGFGLITSILTHSELVIGHIYNPKKILRKMTNNPCTILAVVPPMLRLIIMIKEMNIDLQIAEYVFCSGASCDDVLLQKFQTTFNRPLYELYGSTETGAISTNYSKLGVLAGLGKTYNEVDVSIKKHTKYNFADGELGEIFVRSSSMMQGYYNKFNDNFKKIDYFPTGDIGKINNGEIILKGRIKDIINIGGKKVDSKEVENFLLTFEGIQDVAVYSGCDSNNSEIVLCSFCTQKKEVTIEKLRKYCVSNLTRHKIPRYFHKINEIPRTPSGKCIKVKLPGAMNIANIRENT